MMVEPASAPPAAYASSIPSLAATGLCSERNLSVLWDCKHIGPEQRKARRSWKGEWGEGGGLGVEGGVWEEIWGWGVS